MERFCKKRRGSIALVLVFSIMMAIITLGVLRVSMTMSASTKKAERQYASIQTYRAITEVACYQYVRDLMSCVAIKNLDAELPFASDSYIYSKCIEGLQKELAWSEDVPGGTPIVHTDIWRVREAQAAIAGAQFNDTSSLTVLLAALSGNLTSFELRLEKDLQFDYDNEKTYLGAYESRIALEPVEIEVTLKVKTETIVSNLQVHGLFMYIMRDTIYPASGTPYKEATVRITDDGNGSGVHIYRE